MKTIAILTFIVFTFSTQLLFAQAPDTLWTKTFSGRSIEEGNSVRQNFDSGYYAIPAKAQRDNNKNNLCDIHWDYWQESPLLSDYPDIPLTTPYHPSNSKDEAKILNAIIPDFQVNENSVFSVAPQENPAISADGSGNYIIAWHDGRNGYGSVSQNFDIYAQRYSSDGTAVGINFKVNDDIGNTRQYYPSISADSSGNFIIVWDDWRNGDGDIYAQRYSNDGTALGSNFKVNDDTGSAGQGSPSISADGSGNFIITWDDPRNGDDDIYAQRYSSDGTSLGSNFKVNDVSGSANMWPSISADGSGNFIITWQDSRNGNWDIYAQRYSYDGTALGSNFRVDDDIIGAFQANSSISADSSGNFIIAWGHDRGITIKAHFIRMDFQHTDGEKYIFNLIDTPGHVDFSYEVSRSLAAAEGALLLVDAAQGVEAQTISNLYHAIENDLNIIPVINKIDLPSAQVDSVKHQITELIGCEESEIIHISAKTGVGIEAIVEAIIHRISPPGGQTQAPLQALIFDSSFDNYRGVVALIRVFNGEINERDGIRFFATDESFEAEELGILRLKRIRKNKLSAGEVGYLICGAKNVRDIRVGDTVTSLQNAAQEPLPGYRAVKPMVFSGIYPVVSQEFEDLRSSLEKLALNDSALQYEPETSIALGFGFRAGFFGSVTYGNCAGEIGTGI